MIDITDKRLKGLNAGSMGAIGVQEAADLIVALSREVVQLRADIQLASQEQERLRTEINSAKYQGEQATLKRLHGLFYVLAHDPTALAKAIKAAGTIDDEDS